MSDLKGSGLPDALHDLVRADNVRLTKELDDAIKGCHEYNMVIRDAREEILRLRQENEDIKEDFRRLDMAYAERGAAMRDTGEIVRSLYIPRVNLLRDALERIVEFNEGKVEEPVADNIANDALSRLKKLENPVIVQPSCLRGGPICDNPYCGCKA